MTRTALLAGTVVFIFVASAGAATHGAFKTPSGNIACETWYEKNGNERGLECVVYSASPRGSQKIWLMRTDGRAFVHVLGVRVSTKGPLLGYGQSWRWRGITCTSRKAGLTCRNRLGHGWFLSRQRQRIF